jgi:hypothetical protein
LKIKTWYLLIEINFLTFRLHVSSKTWTFVLWVHPSNNVHVNSYIVWTIFFPHVLNFGVFHFKLFNTFLKYFLSLGRNALEFWGLSFESYLWMPQIISLHFDNSRKRGSIHHIFHWVFQWNKTHFDALESVPHKQRLGTNCYKQGEIA